MSRRIPPLTALLVVALLCTLASSALAGPPRGNWTTLRKDNFVHYACKAKVRTQGRTRWRIRTLTWINGRYEAIKYEIGAYAAITRGSNRNLVATRAETDWRGSYIRMWLGGAVWRDRVWVQGSYYGPVRPWSAGVPVARITRCRPTRARGGG